MNTETSQKSGLKQKAAHEFDELATIFVYLAFFFCALATYSMLLMDKFHISYFTYGAALINALVVAKVILIGEYGHLGQKYEDKPLLYSVIYKAFLFCLLVLAFHFIEELIKRLLHGQNLAGSFRDIRIDDLLARALVVFCTFVPLFAFRELARVLHLNTLRSILFLKPNDVKSVEQLLI